MFSSSPALISRLAHAFNNPETAERCRASARKQILRDQTIRALDEFPDFIIGDDLTRQSLIFKSMLSNITPSPYENEPPLLQEWQKRDVEIWICDIARQGCNELLNDSGKIRQEFIDLLACQNIKSKIKIPELICAYVAVVYAQLANHDPKFAIEHKSAYSGLSVYVNRNTRTWIIDLLYEKGFVPLSEWQKQHDDDDESPIINPTTSLVVAASLALASALGFAAYTFFAEPSGEASEESESSKPLDKIKSRGQK
jgi:hypothetical protein